MLTRLLLLLAAAAPARLQDDCVGSSCYPNLGDLMVGRAGQLTATSTCGLHEPQKYCILGYLENEQKCFMCDSRSPYNSHNSHRIQNLITTFRPERKMRWWQSENGLHEVSIQLDLETMFQFSHLILTFKSFRPAAMLVERSKDFGKTWKIFRYFAQDCGNSFPEVPEGPADSIQDLVCDSRYSGAEPSTDGEVVLKALDPNFEIHDPYNPIIQELITLTNLRVNFTQLLTLGDTLLTRRRRNPQDKYYYALYEMVVRGSCFCNGHASQCVPLESSSRGDTFSQPGMVHGRCVCQHNTAGHNCERCQDFYHDAPWRPGRETDLHVCKTCNCHGHSESCHFDPARYQSSGGLSGGVCEECRNHRAGPQCEQCAKYYHRDPLRPEEDPDACTPCDCDPDGSEDGGLCDPDSGRCVCKRNVEGDRCDRCMSGFYGLSGDDPRGCQLCGCNLMGTLDTGRLCDEHTGTCFCQHFARGPQCDQCLPGFWGLGNTVYGCRHCDCDDGGSLSTECSPVDGQCECRPNMVGPTCRDPAAGHFLLPLTLYIYEAEEAVPRMALSPFIEAPPLVYPPEQPTKLPLCQPDPQPQQPTPPPTAAPPPTPHYPPVTLPACELYFRQRGYDFKIVDGKVVVFKNEKRRKRRQNRRQTPSSALQVVTPHSFPDRPVTWTGRGFVQVQDGAGLRFTVVNVPASFSYRVIVRYELESGPDWIAVVTITPSGSGSGGCLNEPWSRTIPLAGHRRMAVSDASVCLTDDTEYHLDVTLRKQLGSSHVLLDSVLLVPAANPPPDLCSGPQPHRCFWPDGRGFPEACDGLVGSTSALIYNGAAPCDCHPAGAYGASCSPLAGQCHCKPNVTGRCCSSCAPATYGLRSDGCLACDCDPAGSSGELCDLTSGQCPCRDGVSGRRCERCQPGSYGFPSCGRCHCHGLSDACHPVSGHCLHCRHHATGFHCERCEDGYVGSPVSGEACQPCLCPEGKDHGRYFAASCSREDGGAPQCHCLPGHAGLRCDSCAPGFYGDLRTASGRCEKCWCSGNIDPGDGAACHPLSGQCLRCLHHTSGPHCQSCMPGYYGNALDQDCKECSCDRRGTEAVKCPSGGPCLCHEQTGECPCREGVRGALCDECEDGYWNLQELGCGPCSCDPEHSRSSVCDKLTGQCFCQPEYGGRRCDACGANHFGDPTISCMSCDCNTEGSVDPACDPVKGECLCRPGVMGLFCEECAPGHQNHFPACAPCHPCFHSWQKVVTSAVLEAERTQHRIPESPEPSLRPELLRLQGLLEDLTHQLHPHVQEQMERLKEFLAKVRNETDAIDPYSIIIDPTVLLNNDMDNIRHEFHKSLKDLREKTKKDPATDERTLNETLKTIRKIYDDFRENEKNVERAKQLEESSRRTREDATRDLGRCRAGDLDELETKVKALDVNTLNEEICGSPGDARCDEAVCGGALCGRCGGASCQGLLPFSLRASRRAETTERNISALLGRLSDAEQKIISASTLTSFIKDQTEDLKNKISQTKSKYEREKDDTKSLIEKVKNYLRDELVKPEDIEKLAEAVLSIQLPRSPAEVSHMIQDIGTVLANITHFNEDLDLLEKQAKTAEDLKQRAADILNRTKSSDVEEIERMLNDTADLQQMIREDLNQTQHNNRVLDSRLNQTEPKLRIIENRLNSTDVRVFLNEIETLKNKTELNRVLGKEAKASADAALSRADDAMTDLEKLKEQFDKLKANNTNQSLNDVANERLKNITMEAAKLAEDVENKMRKIEDLEKRIQEAARTKEERVKDLEALREEADSLKNFIVDKVDKYGLC